MKINPGELSQSHQQYTMTHPKDNVSASRPQMAGGISTRLGPTQSFRSDPNDHEDNSPNVRSQMGRRKSIRFAPEADATDPPPRSNSSRCLSVALNEERSMSAREAVAAQEAAEAKAAAAAAAAAEEEEEEERGANEGGKPVRMSLMDLLEETDRQMGVIGSRYRMGDEDEEDEYEEEEEDEYEEEEGIGEVEHTCCVCMVRHKGAAFVPCGHTFCRLCSRELWISKGNCPLCNNFILEILDIF